MGNAVGGVINSTGQWFEGTGEDVGNAVGGAMNTAGQWVEGAGEDVGNAVGGRCEEIIRYRKGV